MGGPAEPVVDQGDIELQLAGMLGEELASLQLDHDVAQLLHVKEQQIHVEVVAADVEVDEQLRLIPLRYGTQGRGLSSGHQ